MAITYKDLKGPKGLPIIGSLHKIDLDNMHNQFEEWADEYGCVFKLAIGPKKITVVTDPKVVQAILKNRPDKFRRMAKADEIMREARTHGVFNAEGEAWKAHRRIMTKGLDVHHQQKFYPEILISVERLFNKWAKNADENRVFDIQHDLSRFTVDVTTALAFNYKMNTIEEDGHVIQDHLSKIFPMIYKRIQSPIPFWRYYKTKKDKEFEQALDGVFKFIDELIADCKEKLKNNPELKESPENFLESILVAAENEDEITHEDVKGNLLTILLGGEDTTAQTLAWAIFLLAQNPEIQEKMYEEASHLFGNDKWLSDYDNNLSLIYAEAVALETTRLKPAVPVLSHEALEDIEIEGYLFTKGSIVVLQVRHSGLQEEQFSDPNSFKPERWIKKEIEGCPVNHNPRLHFPFGGGPRFCPGRNLSILELKIVLSMLAKNFKVELITPKEEVKEIMAFAMKASKYDVRLTKRD